MSHDPLPIDAVLPELLEALRKRGLCVLQAPPGAGKTTRVPLALLSAGLTVGKTLILEPRRLAARAAAERMAATLGQQSGETVGYRMRGESRVGPATRIEVVTEGVFTRMIQSDPDLPGVGAVIFDEFHERAIVSDLGLALTLDARAALRPDLLVLVMSATLDAAPVAALMDDAPVVTSQGRSFPVKLHWLDRPLPREGRWEVAMADLIARAYAQTGGGLLAFLPGEGEIRRVEALLRGRLPGAAVRPLYGAMPFAAQRAALAPEGEGRKVVLATAIAETSLTIEGIRVVVDGGRARRARHDPGSGMSRLVTERASRAEATQRAGRAGRVAPGDCYRLWTKGEEGALPAFAPPEMAVGDLGPLALDLALWGAAELRFLTPPPAAGLAEARALLADLGALDDKGRITPHGRAMAALPLHPRLALMALVAGRAAAPLAALLSDRDPLPGAGTALQLRLEALGGGGNSSGVDSAAARRGADPAALARLRAEARRLARGLGPDGGLSAGAMAALAFPDRIGKARAAGSGRYLLSGGKGAVLPPADPLGGHDLIVALDLDGDPREALIRLAAPLSDAELRATQGHRIRADGQCLWGAREGRVLSRRVERLGALTLSDQPWPDAPPATIAAAMLDGVRALGLILSPAAERFCTRVELLRAGRDDLPDMRPEALLATLEDWLSPHLGRMRSAEEWRRFDPLPALVARLDPGQRARLDRDAPATYQTPLGRAVPVEYEGGVPAIAVRLQEMFGTTRHPVVGRTPLKITLLSPGGAPLQVTTDLPRFWATSYAEVRKDMRGRYPRHPWPEDPTAAAPTLRAKPRGT